MNENSEVHSKASVQVSSINDLVSIILKLRNKVISQFLYNGNFEERLRRHFGINAESRVRTEFLRKNLSDLLNSPLDLVHYSPLIRLAKSAFRIDSVALENLIRDEMKVIIDRY